MHYGPKGVELSKLLHRPDFESRFYYYMGSCIPIRGELSKSLDYLFTGLQIAESNNLIYEKALCLTGIGITYWNIKDYPLSLRFLYQSLSLQSNLDVEYKTDELNNLTLLNIGQVYLDMLRPDSASNYLIPLYQKTHESYWHPVLTLFIGDLFYKTGKLDSALHYVKKSIAIFEKVKEYYGSSDGYRILVKILKDMKSDSLIEYCDRGLQASSIIDYKIGILEISRIAMEALLERDSLKAIHYLKLNNKVNEELYGSTNFISVQKALADEQNRQRIQEKEKIQSQNKNRLIFLSILLSSALALALIFYRNQRKEKKAKILFEQKNKIIENTLTQLQNTQAQLIQSEKMASLGELTAGIAHEIQNPLNFVNNFSELNKELITELNDEIKTINTRATKPDEINNAQLSMLNVQELIGSIKENSEKINQHGQRASNIVKGMLEHSRTSSGEKVLTDINALCEEYLRLSYHGLRAKNKDFNCDYTLDLDPNMPKINVVSQDIARVLLNIINNAFQACHEKSESLKTESQKDYKPLVIISTKFSPNGTGASLRLCEISVTDNGPGIPTSIRDKIFQPFFTTKPTGQGTGLGLSLAYDIVKAHGGDITVSSIENEITEFKIQLPIL